ncbi:MAG: late exocytosis, associated with Golgi transport-domain-containing protein [Olpidium bornovanus]|uniref:Late exocytosis, associated with Golgi transport-domain-containing protein n=1 Tax=Olpidium bornovanus TaxID=278681 RepID=A0A8H8A1G7_9FUNG|nr:MAG: late exocytosis, associated with Golgi transport-domain-containing protein [Olpidium bornovanus]
MRADAGDVWLQESATAAAARSQAAAVLTQLGLASGVLFAAVLGFGFLRTRWPSIYVPRRKKPYDLLDKLPTGVFSWLKLVLSVQEEDLTVMIGFDLATFLIALKLFVHLSLFMLVIGAAVLVPVNYYAGLGQDTPSQGDGDTDETARARDDVFQSSKFSIDHVPRGSPFLSVHAACVWIFSAAALASLYRGYRMFISARQRFMLNLEKGPQKRTIMVLGIPRAYRDEEKLRQWFERLDIGLVRSVEVVRDARLIERALKHRYHALCRLEDAVCTIAARARGCSTAPRLLRRVGASGYSAVSNTGDLTEDEARETLRQLPSSCRPKVHTGFGGICGPSVDSFDYYKQKFVEADAEVRWLRKNLNARPFGTAFVEFVAQGSANIAAQLILHTDPYTFVTLMAPDPRDVCWPNAPLPPIVKTVRTVAINACYSFLTVFWAVPTAAITTFLSLSAIERVAPPIAEWMSEAPLVRLFVEGTLPTVVVASLNAVVPHILKCT